MNEWQVLSIYVFVNAKAGEWKEVTLTQIRDRTEQAGLNSQLQHFPFLLDKENHTMATWLGRVCFLLLYLHPLLNSPSK